MGEELLRNGFRCRPIFLSIAFIVALFRPAAARAGEPLPGPQSIKHLVEQVKSAVVGIDAYQTVPHGLWVHTRDFINPFPLRTFIGDTLRFVFYIPRAIVYPFSSHRIGSGFIIDKDGRILTSYHIIQDYNVLYVSLFDGSVLEAHVLGIDEFADIALLQVDPSQVPAVVEPAAPGDSDLLEPGDWVMVVGNPLGLNYTVTSGIVSGVGRQIDVTLLDDLIQIDAALDGGNSGGPVFNALGQVIGIAEANIFLAQNKGFAVPINMAISVLPDLKTIGQPRRGRIGITIEDPTFLFAAQRGLEKPTGARVVHVEEDSPADAAGIRADDLIVTWDGEKINNSLQLVRLVRRSMPGDTAEVELLRTGPPVREGVCTPPVCTTVKVMINVIRKRFHVF